jgi:Leucine-rich repeat (LRR) protein
LQNCANLAAIFVQGNRIITRDLPYICKLRKLVKADLSHNKIHFLPHQLAQLEKLLFLRLDNNELVG